MPHAVPLFPRTFTRPLMDRLGVSRATICLWQRGLTRPPWKALPQIAEMINVPLSEVVKMLWRETVGRPGKCGCGTTVYPSDPTAITLDLEIPCAQCRRPEGKRISKESAHVNHRELCKKCAHAAELIKFTCEGYPDHDAIRWSDECLKRSKVE
jgi:hypothetical protein